MPSQVVLICGLTVPWFQASVPAGSVKQEDPQLALPLLSQKSLFPNSTSDGVRLGSPVTMCSNFSSTGSAR